MSVEELCSSNILLWSSLTSRPLSVLSRSNYQSAFFFILCNAVADLCPKRRIWASSSMVFFVRASKPQVWEGTSTSVASSPLTLFFSLCTPHPSNTHKLPFYFTRYYVRPPDQCFPFLATTPGWRFVWILLWGEDEKRSQNYCNRIFLSILLLKAK